MKGRKSHPRKSKPQALVLNLSRSLVGCVKQMKQREGNLERVLSLEEASSMNPMKQMKQGGVLQCGLVIYIKKVHLKAK